jgi:MscS family membrane protein
VEALNSWAAAVAHYSGIQPWALIVFLIVLAALLADFLQRRLMRRLGRVVEASKNRWDDALFHSAIRPVSLLIWLVGITAAAGVIPLFDATGELGGGLVVRIRQVGVVFALTWLLVGFIKNVENNMAEQSRSGQSEVDETTVRALGRVLRIAVIVTATLVGLDTLGVNIAGLMAAGGIGGLAIGLAARDMIANFFGGVTVFIDRPFGLGDWIVLKDHGVEGVVENIGWRQTMIRKFDKRPVYVPNSLFTTASVENPSRMTHRRIYEFVGLRYDDIAVVATITDEVRGMLSEHPEIASDQTLMVNFDRYNDSSLDFFVYCMTRTVNWQKYHEVKQDVLLKIYAIIDANGASIAYPTRRLQLEGAPQFAGMDAAPPPTEPNA